MGRKLKAFLIVIGILLVLTMFLEEVNVANAISKDDYFKHSTSITSRFDSHDRADVYTSDKGVIETAKHIIEEETPIDHSDLTNEESISLTYDDYYVLVYKGEDNLTYVQVSSRAYVHENGFEGLYRSHGNTIIFFDTSYRRHWYNVDRNRYGGRGYYNKKTDTVKSNTGNTTTKTDPSKIKTDPKAPSKIKTDPKAPTKIKTNNSSGSSSSGSIRPGSTGTRNSVGGGTSFGK